MKSAVLSTRIYASLIDQVLPGLVQNAWKKTTVCVKSFLIFWYCCCCCYDCRHSLLQLVACVWSCELLKGNSVACMWLVIVPNVMNKTKKKQNCSITTDLT